MTDAIDPRLLDLALGVIVLEGVGLLLWRKFRGSGPRPSAVIANLLAGGCLIVVARALLIGAAGFWIVAALTAALAAHAFDLAARWERVR